MEFVKREKEILRRIETLVEEQLDFSPIKLKRTNAKSIIKISLKSL
jgi:hypothetical protein